MISGFEKIVEERIRRAMQDGDFEDLAGAGEPLLLQDDSHIPEDLRLAYKILKNAECLPAEVELRKAVTLKPDYAEGWNFLGENLKARGKEQEAQEAIKKAKQFSR